LQYILPVYVTLRAKPTDLTCEPSREFGSIKPINQCDPTLTGEKLLVENVDVVAMYSDATHASDHDTLLGILLSLRSGSGDGGRDDGESLWGFGGGGGGGIGGFFAELFEW
jgi:hypothetical protein